MTSKAKANARAKRWYERNKDNPEFKERKLAYLREYNERTKEKRRQYYKEYYLRKKKERCKK